MHIQYCFPTAIFHTENEKLAEEMLPLAKKYLADHSIATKILNYKSTYNRNNGLEQYADMKQFANYIQNLGVQFMVQQGYKKENFPRGLRSHIFASETFKGDFHDMHTHPNCIVSGIMYLQAPDGSSPITFSDPKPKSKFIDYEIESITPTNMRNLIFQPKKGLILLWESWLEHSMLDNTNVNEGRITLVFNLYRP